MSLLQVPFLRWIRPASLRMISRTPTSRENVPTPKKDESAQDFFKSAISHKVGNLEKRMFVWIGRYKTVDEVPSVVRQETMEKVRNKVRIKVANYMILATILACFGYIYSGKQAAKRGESVQKMNLDWHRQIKEESEKSK